jgi:hypothetical protein
MRAHASVMPSCRWATFCTFNWHTFGLLMSQQLENQVGRGLETSETIPLNHGNQSIELEAADLTSAHEDTIQFQFMANFESRCRHTHAYVGMSCHDMSCQFLLLHLEHRPPTLYSKWPHRLLLAGLSVTSVKTTITGHKCKNNSNWYA